MYCVKELTKDLYWVGGSDRRLALFENVFPIPRGVSYNSYLLMDEKTVLLDTVDKAVSGQFFENLEFVLGERKLDYLVVNHMEPDHCGTMCELVLRYPDVKIVGNAKTVAMIKQFFKFDIDSRAVIVNEMETLCTGKHTLTFIMAPMVHWSKQWQPMILKIRCCFPAMPSVPSVPLTETFLPMRWILSTSGLRMQEDTTQTLWESMEHRCKHYLRKLKILKSI